MFSQGEEPDDNTHIVFRIRFFNYLDIIGDVDITTSDGIKKVTTYEGNTPFFKIEQHVDLILPAPYCEILVCCSLSIED